MAVIDSDAAKIRVLEWVFGCLVVRKSGDDAASDGREVLGEGRKATVGAIVATAATRAAEKGGADTILPTVEYDEKNDAARHEKDAKEQGRGTRQRDLRGKQKGKHLFSRYRELSASDALWLRTTEPPRICN